MKELLVVIDMQNDFVTGSLGTKEACAITEKVRQKILSWTAEGGEVVFTRDTHGENYLETQEGRKLPITHCIRGSEGWEIIPQLQPFAGDSRIFDKPAFGSVELAEYMGWRIRSSGDDRSLYRYLRGVQCTACQGICAGAAGFGGCVLLCWRHFREPSCGIMYNENVPNFSKIEKNMVKM